MGLRTIPFLLALLLTATACGAWEPAATLEFALDYDDAVASGRIQQDHDRAALFDETVPVVLRRLDELGRDFRWAPVGTEGFRILLRVSLEDDELQDLIALVETLGDVEFRIEVLPTEQYRRYREGDRAPRLRSPETAPWPGTAQEFHTFKSDEVDRWFAAAEAGEPYVPSRSGYRLYVALDSGGLERNEFHVLEEPSRPEERFGGSSLVDPVVVQGQTGQPVILYRVRPERQDAFEAWTRRNIGLPVAIVLNDEWASAPVIQDALRDNVQITLSHGRPVDELRREAERLAMVLQGGALRVRPILKSVTRR